MGTDTPVFPRGRSGIVPIIEFVSADTALGKSEAVNRVPIPAAPKVFRKALRDHNFLFTGMIGTSGLSCRMHGNALHE
jgi:hypothetical protein